RRSTRSHLLARNDGMGQGRGSSVVDAPSGRTMRRRLAAAALATLAVLAGCVDFDEQELRVAYDAKRDQLDAQLIYRGLYSAGNTEWVWMGDPPEEEEDVKGTELQLDQLLSGRPLFWLLTDMAGFDLATLRESDDPQVAALADLVTVDLGAPFRAGDGRLCAWQHLRVRDVHRALELYDARFRSELADTKAAAQVR